jgi:hypothetical protein
MSGLRITHGKALRSYAARQTVADLTAGPNPQKIEKFLQARVEGGTVSCARGQCAFLQTEERVMGQNMQHASGGTITRTHIPGITIHACGSQGGGSSAPVNQGDHVVPTPRTKPRRRLTPLARALLAPAPDFLQ